jgi:digeranylgeranylglycerophospholipid reductase
VRPRALRLTCPVVVLERDDAVGSPVRCGEGVGSAGLAEFLRLLRYRRRAAPWIARRITSVVFRSPDGTTVRVAEGDVGYILDRTRFEPALAAQAMHAAPTCRTRADAIGMSRDGFTVARHVAHRMTRDRDPRARRQSAPTASRKRRTMGGHRHAGSSRDMESCAQYVVAG